MPVAGEASYRELEAEVARLRRLLRGALAVVQDAEYDGVHLLRVTSEELAAMRAAVEGK